MTYDRQAVLFPESPFPNINEIKAITTTLINSNSDDGNEDGGGGDKPVMYAAFHPYKYPVK